METIEIKINSNAKSATNEMSLFRKEIQELRGKLLQLDEGTKEYNDTLSELSNKQFQLREMNENVRYTVTDLGEQLSTVTRITSGVVAGFSAAQGMVALFGGESENLQKIMVRLQAAMAMVQGLQGLEGLGKDLGRAKIQFGGVITSVKTFIGGLSGVQKALIATGIGAFAVALGVLAANWDKVTEAVSKFITKTDEAAVSIDRLDSKQKQLQGIAAKANSELERELKILQAQGATEEELANKRLEIAKSNYNAQSEYVKKLQKEYNEAEFWNKEGNSNWTDEKLSDLKSKLDMAKELEISYKDTVKDIQVDLQVAQIKSDNEQQKQHEKAIADRLQADKKAAEDAVKIKEDEIKRIKALVEAELKEINDLDDEIRLFNLSPEDAEIEELKAKLKQATELYTKWGLDTKHVEDYYKALIDQVKNKYDLEEINAQIENIDTTLANKLNTLSTQDDGYNTGKVTPEEAYNNQLAIDDAILQAQREAYEQKKAFIEEQLNDEDITAERKMALQQALADNEIALDNAVLENRKRNDKTEELYDDRKIKNKRAVLNATAQILSATSTLVGENTAAGKAMAVSSALINTYMSAVGAYNSAVSPVPAFGPASPTVGALFAAAAVAQGLAQVKQILSVDEHGTTSIGASSGVASTPNVTSGMMPTEIVGQQLSDMTDFEINQGESEMKVVVLESDITDTQNKIKTQVSESTF